MTDEQGALLEPLLPSAKLGGRPRTVSLRRVLSTIFDLVKSGRPSEMLPQNLARRSTAHDDFTAWRSDGT